jgi:SSS family solute:Na+ symporter
LNAVDIAIILIYFVGMIAVGLYANKKQKGVDDYYVGGRSMSSFKIGILWMAGWIGGSSVIGTSANGYSMGITAAWYVTAIAMGCIIFAFVMAQPIKRISVKINNITLPELINSRYDAKSSTMASITTILAMIGYTAAQFVAGASILNVLTGWNLGVCYLIAALVIVFYVSTGGLLAVTYTDIIQMALLILGVVVIAVPMCAHMLSRQGVSLSTALPASYFDIGAWGWPTIIAFVVSTILSFFTSMDSFTRCIAARDEKTAKVGTIYAAVLVIIIAGASTYLGMAGKVILPDLQSANNVVAALVVETFPHGLKGLILIGVLSAIMSTADISVLTGSASLTKDIYQKFFNPKATDKTLMRTGFFASLLVGLLGAVFGWFNQDIMNILLITFTINSAGLFLPTVGAFFWKKSCAAAAFASMVSATAIAVAWFVGGKVSSLPVFQIDALWPSLGISAVLYFAICLTHKQTPEEVQKADFFFAAK